MPHATKTIDQRIREAAIGEQAKEELQQFTTYLRGLNYADGTIKSYIHRLIQFFTYIDKSPTEVNKADWSQFLDERRKQGNRVESLNSCYAVLRHFFNDYLELNIHMRKTIRHEDPYRVIPLTLKETRTLLAAEEDKRNRAILELGYDCALRVSEVTRLEREHILPENRVYVERSKGNKSRIIPVSDETLDYINDYLKTRNDKGKQVFTNKAGKPLSTKTIQYHFTRATRKAGLEQKIKTINRKGFHMLRDLQATYLYWAGVDLLVISDFLGHGNPSVTLNHYTHLLEGDHERIPAWWFDRYAKKMPKIRRRLIK